jgi:hypothetical protein
MTSDSGDGTLKGATNLSSCKDPNVTPSPVKHTTSLDIKGFTLRYMPFSTVFGGLHSLTMLDGTSSPATNAKSARQRKSRSHPLSPRWHPSFAKPTSIPCSCPMQVASDTLFKLDVRSLHGQSGVLSKPRLDPPLVPSSSKKSCADGELSRRSLQTMEQPMLPPSIGLQSATISSTFGSQLTTHAPTVTVVSERTLTQRL